MKSIGSHCSQTHQKENMSNEQFQAFFKSLTPKVQKNLKVVEPKDLKQNFLLHVSSQKLSGKKLIPRIGHSQAHQEDRTVPRVCGSPHLFGCYVGQGCLEWNTYTFDPARGNVESGKYYIYTLDFDMCLEPNNHLVYDQEVTDEHWLVSYSPETQEFVPVQVGRMFVKELRIVPVPDKRPLRYLTLMVEVSNDKGFLFDREIHLKKGYYELRNVPGTENSDLMDHSKVEVVEISKSEFNEEKVFRIGTLSYEEKHIPGKLLTW